MGRDILFDVDPVSGRLGLYLAVLDKSGDFRRCVKILADETCHFFYWMRERE